MEINSVNPPSSMGRRKLASPRTQLDRGNWIENAIDVLAHDGVGGLRVEVLAKRCGVTKGSFYWHFKDRRDLLDAVLEKYAEHGSAQFKLPDILEVPPFNEWGNVIEIARRFGGGKELRSAVTELQRLLYTA